MSEKITPAVLVQAGKVGEKYLSNNGVLVEIVAVKVGDVKETRYLRSYPPNSAAIGKTLFLEAFKFKTFERQGASATTKDEVKS